MVTVMQYYYLGCRQDTFLADDKDFSLDTILALADMAQFMAQLEDTPAKDLCNYFESRNFPIWTGINCDRKCVFGTYDKNIPNNDTTDYCICNSGFYGVTCEEQCPGGLATLVAITGKCHMRTGVCSCEFNWNGNEMCGSCTPGYSGEYCQLQQNNILNKTTCAASGDGSLLDFQGITRWLGSGGNLIEPGIYTLIQTEGLNVMVWQVSCMRNNLQKVCVDKISVKFHDVNIKVEYTGSYTSMAYSYIDGQGDWEKFEPVENETATLVRISNSTCIIMLVAVSKHLYTIESVSLGLSIRVVAWDKHLRVVVKVGDDLCCSVLLRGICGSICNNCNNPRPKSPCGLQQINETAIDANITLFNGTSTTVLDSNAKITKVGAGYTACFTNASVSVTSAPIFSVYDTSIEFFVKTGTSPTYYGAILTYTLKKTFQIRHSQTVLVVYGNDIFDTQLSLEDNKWNQISVVYNRRIARLDVYVFNSGGDPKRASWQLAGESPFDSGGTLALGRWQPSIDGSGEQPEDDHFSGCIDHLRLWTVYFSSIEIQTHWNLMYSVADVDLQALWTFDDGTADSVQGILFNNPEYPFKGCTFEVSDAQITFAYSPDIIENTGSSGRRKRSLAVTYQTDICTQVFEHTIMSFTCQNASYSMYSSSYSKCLNSWDTSSMLDTVLFYIDTCQALLNLNTWPGQDLCLELITYDMYSQIGEFCNPPCYHGTRKTGAECNCLDGYWSPTCDTVCPGGVDNACNGYGNCDQYSGSCNCPLNKQGSSNCTDCSDGWYGTDCYIAEDLSSSKVFTRLAVADTLGTMHTLDGLTFRSRFQGEYLLLAVSSNIIIEAKMITCNTNYTCMTLISARIGDDTKGYATITVHGNVKNGGKPLVYINDQYSSLDGPSYFRGFAVHRTGLFDLSLDVTNVCTIIIKGESQYLRLHARIPSNLINQTIGILSGNGQDDTDIKLNHILGSIVPSFNICMHETVKQNALSSASADLLSLAAYTQSYTTPSANVNVTKFDVPECDRFIFYPSDADRKQTMGGYSLRFLKSIAYTSLTLNTSINPNISIELQVKLNSDQNGGVILSYTNSIALTLISESTLVLKLINKNDITVMNTNLTLEKNKWNKILLTYYSNLGYVNIYVFNSVGLVERRHFYTRKNLFKDPGILSIGHWYPLLDALPHTQPFSFSGELDNVLIWNIAVEPTLVMDVWDMDPNLAKHVLQVSWLLDEGDGLRTTDSIGLYQLQMPESPWLPPEWLPSDLIYTKGSLPEISRIYFTNNTLNTIAEKICTKFIINITGCDGIQTSTRDFFYFSCLHAIQASSNTVKGYNVALDLYSVCEIWHNASDTISSQLCDQITAEERSQSNCPRQCDYGFEQDDGTCRCISGYYGIRCSLTCPGSSDNPCSGHGTCLSNGTCHCWWNWNGSGCDSCSTGLTGPNCTVLNTNSLTDSSSRHVAAITSTGSYMTFTGQNIHFRDLTGALLLFRSPSKDVEIHIYQVSCNYGSCIVAVAVNTSTVSIVVLPSGGNIYPRIYKDGQQYKISSISPVALDSSMSVSQLSLSDVVIEVSVSQSLTVSVVVEEQLLQISIKAATGICTNGTGILGSCDSNAKNYTSLTSTEISEYVATNFILTKSVIFEALLGGQTDNSNSGYALFFNNTATVGGSLKFTPANDINGTDFSISIYFKPSSLTGTIMSYAKSATFAIFNSDPLTITCGEREFVTSVSPILNDWNQLILTFKRTESKMIIFHYGTNTSLTYETLDGDCSDLFLQGGAVMLGEWIPSCSSIPHSYNTSFVGLIDEISIWKNPIPESLVFQAHSLNIKLSGFSDQLISLLTFTEGIGYIAYEEVSGNNIQLPMSPWQSPTWKVSDLMLETLTTAWTNDHPITVENDVYTLCTDYFESTSASSDCPRIPIVLRKWFHQRCLIETSNTGNTTDVLLSMVDYASMCGATGEDDSALYQIMCQLNISKPVWVTQKCSGCKFGYKTLLGDCICYYGYYGSSCDKTCPGGSVTPCNNHGICDIGGKCQCRGHWKGMSCDTCQASWIGDDCAVLLSSHSDLSGTKAILIAQVTFSAQILTFDGILFDVFEEGMYDIFKISSSSVSVHVQISKCANGTTAMLCPTGFAIMKNNIVYYINPDSFGSSELKLTSSYGPIYLFDYLEFGGMFLKLESSSRVLITVPSISLNITLIAVNNRLMTTLSFSYSTWSIYNANITGMVTSCNTTKAIDASSCSVITKSNLCTDLSAVVPSSCAAGLIYRSIELFTRTFKSNVGILLAVANAQLESMTYTCLSFTGTGVSVDNVLLPFDHFTLELHVQPISSSGVILCYKHNTSYMCLLNSDVGLLAVVQGTVYNIHMILKSGQWNQLSLAWTSDMQSLEIYVIYDTGETIVKAINVPSKVFTSGGSLSLGEVIPGLILPVSSNIFVGKIDEIRIWSRLNNPTVIKQNWRLFISSSTPDVFQSWSLDEGSGLRAVDSVRGQELFPTNVFTPPKWIKSDLILSSRNDVSSPLLTTLDSVSVTDSVSKCTVLIRNAALSSPQISTVIDAYYETCLQEYESSGTTFMSEALLISVAELTMHVENQAVTPIQSMCHDLSFFTSYMTFTGLNCNVQCVFGSLDGSGTCMCLSSHWGSECSNVCPLGSLGACNSVGQCASSSGQCSCTSHWQGENVGSLQYWSDFAYNRTSYNLSLDYACTDCSYMRNGSDCHFAVSNTTNSAWTIGLLYGSYVTTFDGVSFEMITPGAFQVLNVQGVSMQVLYWPCENKLDCRQIREVSLSSGGTIVSVHASDTNMTVFLNSQNISFPFEDSTIRWTIHPYLRIYFGDSLSVLLFNTNNGLFCSVKITQTLALSAIGMLGNTDGNWIDDLQCSNGSQVLNANEISSSEALTCLKKRFSGASASSHLMNRYKDLNLTSAGYIVHLNGTKLEFQNITMPSTFTELTIAFWIRIGIHGLGQVFFELTSSIGNLKFTLNQGSVAVTWGSTYYFDVIIQPEIWTYVSFVWKSSDGSLVAYLITQNDFQHDTLLNIQRNISQSIQGMAINSDVGSFVEIDHIRVWSMAKSLNDIVSDMTDYSSRYRTGLELVVLLDEGSGYEPILLVNSGTQYQEKSGIITGGASEEETWVPSSIPIPDVHITAPLETRDAGVTDAVVHLCLQALNNTNITDHCTDFGSVGDSFFEACVREYTRTGETSVDVLTSAVLVYCQAIHELDECLFDGYLDFCQPTKSSQSTKDSLLIIIISSVCSIVLLVLIIIVIVYCYKRKSRKKALVEENEIAGQVRWAAADFITDDDELLCPSPPLATGYGGRMVETPFNSPTPPPFAMFAKGGYKRAPSTMSNPAPVPFYQSNRRPSSGGSRVRVQPYSGTDHQGRSDSVLSDGNLHLDVNSRAASAIGLPPPLIPVAAISCSDRKQSLDGPPPPDDTDLKNRHPEAVDSQTRLLVPVVGGSQSKKDQKLNDLRPHDDTDLKNRHPDAVTTDVLTGVDNTDIVDTSLSLQSPHYLSRSPEGELVESYPGDKRYDVRGRTPDSQRPLSGTRPPSGTTTIMNPAFVGIEDKERTKPNIPELSKNMELKSKPGKPSKAWLKTEKHNEDGVDDDSLFIHPPPAPPRQQEDSITLSHPNATGKGKQFIFPDEWDA